MKSSKVFVALFKLYLDVHAPECGRHLLELDLDISHETMSTEHLVLIGGSEMVMEALIIMVKDWFPDSKRSPSN